MKIARLLAFFFCLFSASALAQYVTPVLGVNATGTQRTVCIFQPVPGGSCSSMGSYNTGTGAWTLAPNVTALGVTSNGPVTFTQNATIPFCPTTGCITGTTQTAILGTFNTVLTGAKLETGYAFNSTLSTGYVFNWSASTAFTAGQEVFGTNQGVWVETVPSCVTGTIGFPPSTPPASPFADGTCSWTLEQSVLFYGKIGASFFTSVTGSLAPSASWGIYNDFTIMPGTPVLNFWAAEEIAVSNQGHACSIGSQSCSGLLIDGFVTNPGTFAINIAPQGTTAAWHYGLYMGPFSASDGDIGLNDSGSQYAIVSGNIGTVTHSTAAFGEFSTSPLGLNLAGTYSSWAIQALTAASTFKAATIGNSSGSTSTPTQLSFDSTFSSTSGSNPKINLLGTGYGANVFGFGVRAGALDYMAQLASAHVFWTNGSQDLNISTAGIVVGSAGTVGSATPTRIGMDGTFSSTPGANPKIVLQGAGNGANVYGFGITGTTLDYMAPTGIIHDFWINGVSSETISSTAITAKVPVIVPSYTIATLPSCVAGLSGARAVVTNGQTSPTYLGAVSTTGAVVAPVMCNGSGWVYG